MQLQRLIGRGSSAVRARNPTPTPTPLRTFRETPCYLSCGVRFLPPYPPWTFAIIIFYSHVSCSLDSERYLLQTPLAFFFFTPLQVIQSHFTFLLHRLFSSAGHSQGKVRFTLLIYAGAGWAGCTASAYLGLSFAKPLWRPFPFPQQLFNLPSFDIISTPKAQLEIGYGYHPIWR